MIIIANKFPTIMDSELTDVVGGRNTWQQNVSGVAGAAAGGAALGAVVGGPAGAFLGAHYGPILWTAVTGFTGGF
ncbi:MULTISPECIES: Blp family class II bacteriocin [Lacticaseibacillus]|uniref:Blp family class II bacteriocin n=1 Tax=Lacticaseibacillus TaxID=2759736 RepID=UPI00024925DE